MRQEKSRKVVVKEEDTEGMECRELKPGRGSETSGLDTHLVPVCSGNVIVLCPEVGCSHNEIHMEVGVIILLWVGGG